MPIIYVFFPETKGLELEDMDRLFSGDSSLGLFNEKQEVANEVANVEDNKTADIAL